MFLLTKFEPATRASKKEAVIFKVVLVKEIIQFMGLSFRNWQFSKKRKHWWSEQKFLFSEDFKEIKFSLGLIEQCDNERIYEEFQLLDTVLEEVWALIIYFTVMQMRESKFVQT